MHIVINLDILDDNILIGLQATIEVVQVMNTRETAGRGVEQFRRDRLRERIIPFFLPARDKIVAIFRDHAIQFGDLVRTILQVRVHRDDHIALGTLEPAVQTRRFSVITTELDRPNHIRRLLFQLLYDLPRIVRAAIVNKNHLVTEMVLMHHPLDPLEKLGQRFRLIIQRNND